MSLADVKSESSTRESRVALPALSNRATGAKTHRPVGERRQGLVVRREAADFPVGEEADDLVGAEGPEEGARSERRGGTARNGRQVNCHRRLCFGHCGPLDGNEELGRARRLGCDGWPRAEEPAACTAERAEHAREHGKGEASGGGTPR